MYTQDMHETLTNYIQDIMTESTVVDEVQGVS